MTRSILMFAASAALLMLLIAILLWTGLDPAAEEIARWKHGDFIVET